MAGNNAFGNLNICMRTSSTVILACILASALQIFLFSPISPDLLQLPQPSSAALLTNKKLQVSTFAFIFCCLLNYLCNAFIYNTCCRKWLKLEKDCWTNQKMFVLMERAYCIQPQEMGGSKDCIEMGHGRIGG